MRQLPTGHAN